MALTPVLEQMDENTCGDRFQLHIFFAFVFPLTGALLICCIRAVLMKPTLVLTFRDKVAVYATQGAVAALTVITLGLVSTRVALMFMIPITIATLCLCAHNIRRVRSVPELDAREQQGQRLVWPDQHVELGWSHTILWMLAWVAVAVGNYDHYALNPIYTHIQKGVAAFSFSVLILGANIAGLIAKLVQKKLEKTVQEEIPL